jgi:DtxR family Mn-dependent transcriptional regulator
MRDGKAGLMYSESVEDYLKAIYEIESSGDHARTSILAEKLEVSAASVSEMLKRLSRMTPRLVSYAHHRGVRLTAAGEKVALSVIRRHRLLETFLHDVLEFSWDEIHDEADRLEHYISERLTDRLAAHLGHPIKDPHGDPIPRANGLVASETRLVLSKISEGQSARIARVHHSDSLLLKYLDQKGVRPLVIVTMVEKAPLGGPITILVGEGETAPPLSLDPAVASRIYVEPVANAVARQPLPGTRS